MVDDDFAGTASDEVVKGMAPWEVDEKMVQTIVALQG